jgi:NitT/TauT family transport system substrate-binding protein
MIPKKAVLRFVWLLAVAFAAFGGSIQAQAQTQGGRLKKVRLAIPSLSGSNMPAIMARELGFYRQEGFETEIIVMRGSLSVQALVAGSVDFTGTPGATVAAAVQGIKVSVVMAYSNKPLYDLVVRPEISTYAELKGKIFGLGSLTGFAYDIPRLMLSRNGVDPKQDIKMISIGSTADRWTALKTNAVQATLLEPPYTFIAAKEGFHRLEYSGDYYQTLFGALTTSEQKIKAEPDEVSRFVKATAQGFIAYRDRRDVAIATLQRFLKLPDKMIAQQNYDYHRKTLTDDGTITDELMRTIIESQRQSAGVTRPVATEEVFNFAFVRAAMTSLTRK